MKRAFVLSEQGVCNVYFIRDEHPRIQWLIDLGIPNFTCFMLELPIPEDNPAHVQIVFNEGTALLLKQIQVFLSENEFGSDGGLLQAIMDAIHETEIDYAGQDLMYGYEILFTLSSEFYQLVQNRLVKQKVAGREEDISKAVWRGPDTSKRVVQQDWEKGMVQKRDKKQLEDAKKIIDRYKQTVYKNTPGPLYVIMYDRNGMPRGVSRVTNRGLTKWAVGFEKRAEEFTEIPEDILEVLPLIHDLSGPVEYGQDALGKVLNYRERIDLLRKSTGRALPVLGEGSSRIVLAVSDTVALKVAMNTAGVAQNKTEYNAYKKVKDCSIIARIFYYDTEYHWLLVERIIRGADDQDFEQYGITDTGWDDASGVFVTRALNPNAPMPDRLAVESLRHLVQIQGGNSDDIKRNRQWGVVRRDGEEYPVLVDYGFDTTIRRRFYSSKTGAMTELSHDVEVRLPLHILTELTSKASKFDPDAQFRFVGGCVRDMLLGRKPKDVDVVTNTTAQTLERMGLQNVGKAFPVYLHQDEQYGQIEVAVARTEEKTGLGHKGFDTVPTGNFEDDVQRRDLNINAMMIDADGKLYGPPEALQNIQSQTFENVSEKFAEDPLRVFRVARFAAQFGEGWKVSERLVNMMHQMQPELGTLPADRIREETRRALNGKDPIRFFEVLREADCVDPWFSELHSNWDGVVQAVQYGAKHHWGFEQQIVGLASQLTSPDSLINRLGLSEQVRRAAQYVKQNRMQIENVKRLPKADVVGLVQKGSRGVLELDQLLACALLGSDPIAARYLLSCAEKMRETDMTGVNSKQEATERLVGAIEKTASHKTAMSVMEAVEEAAEQVQAELQRKPKPWQTPAFKRWFGDSKVVNRDGSPKRVMHGTTHDFDQFAPVNQNNDNYYGGGYYFTDCPVDVSENYGTVSGPDLTGRIESLAEQIINDYDDNNGEGHDFDPSEEEIEGVKQVPASNGEMVSIKDERDAIHELATRKAKQMLAGRSTGHVVPVFLKMENPVIVSAQGGTYLPCGDSGFNNPDDEDDYTEGEADTRLYEAWEDTTNTFDCYRCEAAWGQIQEQTMDGGLTALKFEQIVRESEVFIDSEGGPGSAIAYFYDLMGYDGIIMDASAHFPTMKMNPGTMHYIVWDAKQIKSATGNSGKWDPTSPLLTASYHDDDEEGEEDEEDDRRWEPVFPKPEDAEPGSPWEPVRVSPNVKQTEPNPSPEDTDTRPEPVEPYRSSSGYQPHRTVKAYKLFRVDPRRPGKLFPLFVDSNTPLPMGVWIDAKAGDQTAEGKVKSKLGPLAYRPGFHAGDVPVATHIGLRGDPKAQAPTTRNPNYVWAEVEMPADVDWQAEAQKRMRYTKDQKPILNSADIKDQVPFGGHYRYKTNPNMTGDWMISGNMRINRVLPDQEVQAINGKAGVSDLPRSQPLDLDRFGFSPQGRPKVAGVRSSLLKRADPAVDPLSPPPGHMPNYRVSPRIPKAPVVKYDSGGGIKPFKGQPREDALAPKRLQPGLETMQSEPTKLKKNVDLMRQYPNFGKLNTNAAKAADQIIEMMKDNLVWLFEQWEEHRDRSKLWYVGGNELVHRWSKRFNLEPHQIAGVLAAMSPERPWFGNVTLAERFLVAMQRKDELQWDSKMSVILDGLNEKQSDRRTAVEGKSLAEVEGPSEEDMWNMTLWIKCWDLAHNPRGCRVLTPEGQFGDTWKTEKGRIETANVWKYFDHVIKSIKILRSGTLEDISNLIGQNHKVRSFYNNLIAPLDEEDVTIDTHAVAAALLRPLGTSDIEVTHNFGGKGTADSVSGSTGLYGLYAEAYRRAAKQMGVLPREMQSITWEAVRGLFKSSLKRSIKEQANAVWLAYTRGEADADATRLKIKDLGKGFDRPTWVGPHTTDVKDTGDSSYEGKLSSLIRPRLQSSRVPGGGDRVFSAVRASDGSSERVRSELLKTAALRFNRFAVGAHHDQTDMRLEAYAGKLVVGSVDYCLFRDEVYVQGVHIGNEILNRLQTFKLMSSRLKAVIDPKEVIGRELVKQLQRENPGKDLRLSESDEWPDLEYDETESEYAPLFREQMELEAKKVQMEQRWEGPNPPHLTEEVRDEYEAVIDRLWELERDLNVYPAPTMKKRLVRTSLLQRHNS